MNFLSLLIVFIGLIILFFIYSSYIFQLFLHKQIKKKFINRLKIKVKGINMQKGYFAATHKIISQKEYKSLSNRERLNYSQCYNILVFKTEHTNWELFFHLVKDGTVYSEVLNIRAFPIHNHIRSEGNVEKNYSRLNIYTNNRYLSSLLEEKEMRETLGLLVKNNGDSFLVNHNGLHYKAFLTSKEKLDHSLALDIIKTINSVKNKIYKSGILEY